MSPEFPPSHRLSMLQYIDQIGLSPDKVVTGTFSGQTGPVKFFIKGSDVVLTKASDNTFISILKDGVNNKFVQAALKQ